MRDQYHDDLDAITESLVRITRLAGTAVNRATQSLLDADLEAAESVISGDDAIDDLYVDVEARAMELLARQQPVASDLRAIVAGLRMVVDIERMGDYATHIAELARRRYPASAIPAGLQPIVLEMGQVAQRIVTKCASLIATRDVKAAAELERDDDVMDDLHKKLFTILLDSDWQGDVERAVDVILCGRYYERFCDHAVSVARRVVYLVTGVRAEVADIH